MTSLRESVASNSLVQAMATHSPLSAKLAEEAGFNALWASGFELSAHYGLPDASLITMTQHIEMLRAIASATSLPVVADIDTGFGNAVNVVHAIHEYERAGAAAVVIEDKTFPKMTSLVADGRQDLVRIEEFEGKIEAACATRQSEEFLVIARTEALIAGLSRDAALERGEAYAEAGADMILIHSKQTSPHEIEDFIEAWGGCVPLVLVPTAYPDMTVERIKATGKVAMTIWGNHTVRAIVTALREAYRQILSDGGIHQFDKQVASVAEIFHLQGMDKVKEIEKQFLR